MKIVLVTGGFNTFPQFNKILKNKGNAKWQD
jgi:hypothetical protein